MVATMDVTWSFQDGNLKVLWEDTNAGGKDRTYAYLLDRAVPWMQANGISKTSTDKFIVSNPRRIFTCLKP
jgi:predicted metal-dependent phosphotriesterase family hydrolase